jgi:hypothetical protein
MKRFRDIGLENYLTKPDADFQNAYQEVKKKEKDLQKKILIMEYTADDFSGNLLNKYTKS